MDFVCQSVSEFVGIELYGEMNLEGFEASLRSMLESATKASAQNDSSEEFQKNLIIKFLRENFGYECNTLGKADLAIYDEGVAKVLFEVKSTQNKAKFVKSPNLHSDSSLRESATADSWQSKSSKSKKQGESMTQKRIDKSNQSADSPLQYCDSHNADSRDLDFFIALRAPRNDAWNLCSKAFYESILYFLREFHKKKNNNIKHIILCTAREFYVIKAQTYHALFIANANKATQKRIDTAYKNCDNKQGNDTSTRKFYDEIESILRELDNTLDFAYVNVSALLSDEVEGDLEYNLRGQTRERERVSAGIQIAS